MPTERLRDAAGRADFLINVLPANADNALLFDRTVFAAMKPPPITSAPAAVRRWMSRP